MHIYNLSLRWVQLHFFNPPHYYLLSESTGISAVYTDLLLSIKFEKILSSSLINFASWLSNFTASLDHQLLLYSSNLAPIYLFSFITCLFRFLFPALGGLLFGYDIGATSGATISLLVHF